MTISGVKSILNTYTINLDDRNSDSLRTDIYKDILKLKSRFY